MACNFNRNCNNTCIPNCCRQPRINVINNSIIGPTGPTGATGPTGESITLTIGTVTTGAPGTQADASITGEAPNYILNLTIPQGPTGLGG